MQNRPLLVVCEMCAGVRQHSQNRYDNYRRCLASSQLALWSANYLHFVHLGYLRGFRLRPTPAAQNRLRLSPRECWCCAWSCFAGGAPPVLMDSLLTAILPCVACCPFPLARRSEQRIAGASWVDSGGMFCEPTYRAQHASREPLSSVEIQVAVGCSPTPSLHKRLCLKREPPCE